jgi:hypothetical protein
VYISYAIANQAPACSGDTAKFSAGHVAAFLTWSKSLSSFVNLRSRLPCRETTFAQASPA